MNISGGKFKGQRVIAPDERITRPTLSKVRMGFFNTLFSILGDFDNLSFLDVYSGSGIMGLEAISRGFKTVTSFELNKKSALILKKNYENLGLKPNLIVGNALNLIHKLQSKYDVAYVDPPYSAGIYEETLVALQGRADIIILEHPVNMECSFENIIKQKKYGDKYLTYIKQG